MLCQDLNLLSAREVWINWSKSGRDCQDGQGLEHVLQEERSWRAETLVFVKHGEESDSVFLVIPHSAEMDSS